MHKIITFIILLCFTFFNAQKVNHLVYHITPEDGLPSKQIFNILEDDKGFVWLGTNAGLYRYDGKLFELYRYPHQQDISVFGLKFDDKKRIWYNTLGGRYFYVENDEVKLCKDFSEISQETLRNFSVIDDALYLNLKGVLKVDIKTKKEEFLTSDGAFQSSIIKFQGKKWLVTNEKMHAVEDLKNIEASKNYLINPMHINIDDKALFSIGKTRQGQYKFKLFTSNSVKEIKGFNELKGMAIHNAKLLDGTLFVLTSRGAFQYAIDDELNFGLKDEFLPGKQVTDIIKDRQGFFWFTTLNSGVYIVPDASFLEIKRNFIDEYITEFESIDDHNISYIEGKKHFTVLNTESAHVQSKDLESYNQRIFYDDYSGALSVFVGQKVFTHPNYKDITKSNEFNVIAPKDVTRISEDELVGTYYNRINILNSHDFSIRGRVPSRSRMVDFNKKTGEIYVDFTKGLKVGKTTDNLKNITYKEQNIQARCLVVRPNSDEAYIVSKYDEILVVQGGKVKEEIPLKGIKGINTIAADERNLWLGNKNGLYRYDLKTKKVSKFKKIIDFQVKKIELTKSFIWLVSDDKIIRVPKYYKSPIFKTQQPYFKSIKIGDEKLKNDHYVTVNNRSKSIRVEFMMNGFKLLDNYQLEYQISDENWNAIDGNLLTLSSLPYGEQILSVRAIDKESGNITKTTQLTLYIVKPFYKTKWFIGLVFLLMSLLLYLVVKKIIKNQDDKKAKAFQELQVKQQLTNLKLENLRSQMNPHFIFNALNSIQEFIYNSEQELASSYLVKFSRLIRIYLEHSRVSEISLSQEIEALELYLYLENNRFEGLLDYTINIDETINRNQIMVPSLFIQPYVENALKHGLLHKKDNRELNVIFRKESERQLIVIVQDNGIGREASAKINANRNYTSFATKANSNRVELMNIKRDHKINVAFVDLKNQQGEAAGTKVIITLPLNQ